MCRILNHFSSFCHRHNIFAFSFMIPCIAKGMTNEHCQALTLMLALKHRLNELNEHLSCRCDATSLCSERQDPTHTHSRSQTLERRRLNCWNPQTKFHTKFPNSSRIHQTKSYPFQRGQIDICSPQNVDYSLRGLIAYLINLLMYGFNAQNWRHHSQLERQTSQNQTKWNIYWQKQLKIYFSFTMFVWWRSLSLPRGSLTHTRFVWSVPCGLWT